MELLKKHKRLAMTLLTAVFIAVMSFSMREVLELRAGAELNQESHYFDTSDFEYGGTKNAYRISSAEDLIEFSEMVNSSEDEYSEYHAYLSQDIDMTGESFTPIGTEDKPFKCDFDGNGKTITGLTVSGDDYSGLFGYTDGATIAFLTLSGGTIEGNDYVGGIVGRAENTKIVSCGNKCASVTGSNSVGGIVGYGVSAEIKECYNHSNVTGKVNVGGIVGYLEGVTYNTAFVANSYNKGDITAIDSDGGKYAGGIIGYYNVSGEANFTQNCYNAGYVKGINSEDNLAGGECIGGIIGYVKGKEISSNSSLSYTINFGTVTGTSKVGAIIGYVDNQFQATQCYYNMETCSYFAINNADDYSEKVYGLPPTGLTFKHPDIFGSFEDYGWGFNSIGNDKISAESATDGECVVTYNFPYLDGVGDQSNTIKVKEHDYKSNFSSGHYWKPYIEISTPDELKLFSSRVNAGEKLSVVMKNDIDMDGIAFTPISTETGYSGGFDGCGYVIKNLTIDTDKNGSGFFGYTNQAIITNLGVIDCDITGTVGVGALCGASNNSSFLHCYATGKVTGTQNVGGFAGQIYSDSKSVSDCYSVCDVTGTEANIGGFIGFADAQIKYCFSAGTVTSTEDAAASTGGFAGYSMKPLLDLCYYDKSICTAAKAVGKGYDTGTEGLSSCDILVNGVLEEALLTTNNPDNIRTGIWTFKAFDKAENVFDSENGKNITTLYYPMLTVFENTNGERAEDEKLVPTSAPLTFHTEYEDDIEVTYDDTIDFGVKVWYTLEDDTAEYPSSGTVSITTPEGSVLSGGLVYNEGDDEYNSFTYDTFDKALHTGDTAVTIGFTDSESNPILAEDCEQDITVTLNPYLIEMSPVSKERVYNGTTDAIAYIQNYDLDKYQTGLNEVLKQIKCSFTLPSADVGTYTEFSNFTVTITSTTTQPDIEEYYKATQESVNITYKITPCNLENVSAAPISIQPYIGEAIEPLPVLTFGSMTLEKDTDYTLAYSNNINEGTAIITVTGKGNYTGAKSIEFTIKKLIKAKLKGITLSGDKTYDGTAISYSGTPRASYNGNTVTFDKYEIRWLNKDGTSLLEAPVKAGTYFLSVFGSNDEYYVSEKYMFVVTKALLIVTAPSKEIKINETLPTLDISEVTYNGFVNDETSDVLTIPENALAYESGATNTRIGTFKIRVSGITAENYDITFINGTLTVKSASPSDPTRPTTPTTPQIEPIGTITDGLTGSTVTVIGWTDLATQAGTASAGSIIEVALGSSTTVPATFVSEIIGKDIIVEFVNANGTSLTINGMDIDTAKSISIGISTGADVVSVDVVNAVIDEISTTGISFEQVGSFGFKAKVTVNLGAKNAGYKLNLYPVAADGTLTFAAYAPISADGTATFYVTEGGKYLAVIDDISRMPGDADDDGVLNVKDALHLLKYCVDLEKLQDKKLGFCDFNGDGRVNMDDAIAILKKIVS